MAILVNENSQVVIQGATGREGGFHTGRLIEAGVKVVAGVTPGRAGQEVHGVPVFDTVAQAGQGRRIDASMIIVPPFGVLDAAMEAIAAKIPLIVIITEFVPLHDTMRIRLAARRAGAAVIGPNTIGVISPGRSQVGIMPGFIYGKGDIGIISRSGTLAHEVSSNLKYLGLGQSTVVGIGGDPIRGSDFVDLLEMFRHDDETKSLVLLGEIGGASEEMAGEYIKQTGYPKRVTAFIAGATAPAEKKMGHAGAIVSGGVGTAESKTAALRAAGVNVAESFTELLEMAAA